MILNNCRIGYVPYSDDLTMPGDRRRFVNYARKRGLQFEIASPDKQYDVVVLSELADISVWCKYDKGKIVYDLIDSYLAVPFTSVKGQLRGFAKFFAGQSRHLQINHWRAIQFMCKRSAAVVCTTQEQRSDILPFCDNVHIILDVHSMVAQTIKKDYLSHRPFKIAWEGLPQTLTSLAVISNVLRDLDRCHAIELNIVTDPKFRRFLGKYGTVSTDNVVKRIFPDARLHEWREDSCAEILCDCDLAIIPLPLQDPFASGKPENKLLLCWRMGLPVVTSASPAYVRAMNSAGIDTFCRSDDEWSKNLMRCIQDDDFRKEIGLRGHSYSESFCNEENILASWDNLFDSI